MSLKNTETPLLHRFWREVGGLLIEEFVAVRRGPGQGQRRIDGVIVRDKLHRIVSQRDIDISGKDIIVVQVESGRLGMYLMGQTLFSKMLMEAFSPKSIESVAVCCYDDARLHPLLKQFKGCRVVLYPDLASLKNNREIRENKQVRPRK